MSGRSLVPPVLSCRSLVHSLISPRSVADAPRGPAVDSSRSPVPPVLSFGSLVLSLIPPHPQPPYQASAWSYRYKKGSVRFRNHPWRICKLYGTAYKKSGRGCKLSDEINLIRLMYQTRRGGPYKTSQNCTEPDKTVQNRTKPWRTTV